LHAIAAPSKNITWKSTLGMPWIGYSESDSLLAKFAKYANIQDLPDRVSLYCDNWLVICELVAERKGAAVIPFETLGTLKRRRFHAIEIPRTEETDIFYAIYRRELQLVKNLLLVFVGL
jgi:DNA-binding transcriptional LysR family regulator